MATSDDFPIVELTDPEDDQAITKLIRYLQKRVRKRDLLREEGNQKQINFRNTLVQLVREYESLKHCSDEQKLIISTLEGRICKLQNQIDGLLCKLNSACEAMRNMQQEVKVRDEQLKQQEIDRQKIIPRFNAKIQMEIDRVTKEMEKRLCKQQEWFENCIKKKDDKLKLVRSILSSVHDNASDNAVLKAQTASTESTEESIPKPIFKKKSSMMMPVESRASKSLHYQVRQKSPFHVKSNIEERTVEDPIPMTSKKKPIASCLKTEIVQESLPTTSVDPSPSSIASADTVVIFKTKLDTKVTKRCKIPVVNPRYRSKSADKWIDHRPAGIVPTGTILQPQMQPQKRTIRKLMDPTFVKRSSRYCLFAQEQDTDGELETKLYKADVLPTCGGGAQIVFNDIEYLKQLSPNAPK